MSQEALHEVWKQYRSAEDKYVYFLLAVAGAGIALAVNRTAGSSISLSQLPLAAAVLSWALSFFFGCRHILYVNTILFDNYELLQIESGTYRGVEGAPPIRGIASAAIREVIEEKSKKAVRHARRQFTFLVAGAFMYVAWHVVEMSLRSLGSITL